jgi:hypothetical protein
MAKGFNLTAELNLRGPSNIKTVVADIRRQVGSISASITPTINKNSLRSVVSDIKRQMSNISASINITANPSSIRSLSRDVRQALSGLSASVNVTADPASIRRAAANIRSQFANINANINVTPSTASIRQASSTIRRQLGTINANVSVNVSAASVRQAATNIRRQLGSINANINVGINAASLRGIGAYTTNLARLNTTLAQTTTTATNAAGAIAALTAAMGAAGRVNLGQINVNLGNAGNAARNAANNVQLAGNEIENFGRQAGLAVRRFAAFSAVTSVIYGITNAVRNGITAFIDYDLQLTRISQVTGDAKNTLGDITNTVNELATSLGVSSNQLTTATVTLAQAGLTARDTERALKALALSALAPSFDDMNQTVEGSIALMRQFGITTGQLEGALGSINSVSAKFAVEASDIITAIQRTGGVFAAASKGVSTGTEALNEFIAVFTSIRATTRESAETIATGLRTIFTRLQRADTIEALKEFGVTLTDLEGKFVGPYIAVQRLSEGLSKLDPRDLSFSRIVEELGGFRQIGKVLPLIQQFATAQDALRVAQQGQGSLSADAAKGQMALAIQISKVREEFLALIRSVGNTDSFQMMVKVGLDLASALIKVADAAKNLIPLIGLFAAFRGVQAVTQFAGGFGRGFRGTGQRAHEGGIIRHFASGGLVPGSGNSDSVSAKLTPGEFVMTKSAVQKYGAGNLVRMNKYAKGGPVTIEELKTINPSAVQPDYRNVEDAKNKTGEKDQTWSIYRDKGKIGKVRTTAVKYMQPKDEVYGDVDYMPVPDPNRSEVEKYFGKIVLKKGTKFINPKDKRISTAYEDYAQDKVKTIGARYSGDYDPLDFETGDVKFYSSEENIQKYVSINKVLSKRLRHQNKDNRIKWQPNSPEQKELEPTTIYHPTDLTENNNLKKRISDWVLLSQNQKTTQVIKMGDAFNSGGLVQKFAEGGKAIRRVGIIDSDVLRDQANAEKVSEGMKLIGVSSTTDYALQLGKMAAQSRKANNLKKFRAIAGAAASGKSSLATGVNANDNATLRQTIRSHILTPQDINNVDEVIAITSTVGDAKLDAYLRDTDRTYTVSSSTKEERDLVHRNKKDRDTNLRSTLYGRKPGTAVGASLDFANEEATLIDELGSKNVVLGRKKDEQGNLTNKFRRKKANELPEIVQAAGFYTGGFAPPTRGHRGAFDILLENIVAKNPNATLKDIVVSVAPNLPMVEGKEGSAHAARYGIFDADFRSLLAKVNFGGAMISQDAQSVPGILPKLMEVPGENNRRKFARLKGAMAITSGKEEGVLGKYERAGLKVTDISRIEDISATQVRELLFNQNYTALDKIVNPEVGAILKGNQPQLKNRSIMVPSLLEEINKVSESHAALSNSQVQDILQNAPGGPYANVSKKLKEEHPEIASQVELIRKQRDSFKRFLVGGKAHDIISQLAIAYPDTYGIDPSRKIATTAATISSEDAISHIGDRVRSLLPEGTTIPESSLLENIKQNVTKQLAIPKGSGTLPTDSKTITSSFLRTIIPNDPKFGMFAGKPVDPGIVNKVWRQTYSSLLSEDKTANYIAVKEWLEAQYKARTGAKTEKLSQAIQESKMVGLAGMLPIGHEQLSGPFTWMLGKNAAGEDVSVTASIIERGLGKQYEEIVKQAQAHAEQGSAVLASGLAKKQGSTTDIKSLDKTQLETLGQGNIEGAYIEQALARLGASLNNVSSRTRPIDYPDGLGESAKFFPGISPTMPTEVKRTINSDSRSDAIKEFQRYFRLINGISEPEKEKTKKEAVQALATGGKVQKLMAGGVATKTAKFGSGEYDFPPKVAIAYEQNKQGMARAISSTKSQNMPANERMMIDDNKVGDLMSEQSFDQTKFNRTFGQAITRDTLYQNLASFAKFIGLPEEDFTSVLPRQIDFGRQPSLLGAFYKNATGTRGTEGFDIGFPESDKQDLFGYEFLATEAKKKKNNREQITFFEGKARTLRAKQNQMSASVVDAKNKESKITGRGTVALSGGFFTDITPTYDTLYHELTHQLLNSIRARSSQAYEHYQKRVVSLFDGDNNDLADAFDILESPYKSSDIVYGRSYKLNEMLNNERNLHKKHDPSSSSYSDYINDRRPKQEKEKISQLIDNDRTKYKDIIGKTQKANKAREFRPINPLVNDLLLSDGMPIDILNSLEDSGKEEFLTTLVQLSYKLDKHMAGILDTTLTETLGNAGIDRQRYAYGGGAQKFAGVGMASSKQIEFINSLLSRYGINDLKALYGQDFSGYSFPSINASMMIENLKGNMGIDLDLFKRLVASGKARMTAQGIPALTKDMGSSLYSIKDLISKGISIDDFFKRNAPDAKENPGMYSLDTSKLPPKLPKLSSIIPWNSGASTETYSTGVGRRRKRYAFGGIVPGVGNSDTVPATLNAGDFVIRKSSVNKLGLGATKKFAVGGEVPALLTPGELVIPAPQAQKIGYSKLNTMNKFGRYNLGGPVGNIQSFAVGGAVQRLFFGGSPITPRPDNPTASNVVASGGVVAELKTLQEALTQLGITSSSTAELFRKGGAISYQAATKAMEADLLRMRVAGASASALYQAEQKLKRIRQEQTQDLNTRQNLKGLSGGQLQQIDTKANVIRQKMIQQQRKKLVASGLSEDEVDTQLGSEKVQDKINKKAYQKATISTLGAPAATAVFKNGVTGSDISRYTSQAMMDRKTLAQMDAQLIKQRQAELAAALSASGATKAQRAKAMADLKRETDNEIKARRQLVNDLAKQQGISGPNKDGSATMGAAFGLQMAGSLIAQNINPETSSSNAQLSAGLQGATNMVSTGTMIGGGLMEMTKNMSPMIQKLAGPIGMAATAALAVGQGLIDARNASIEFEKKLLANKTAESLEKVTKGFEKLNTDLKNIRLQEEITKNLIDATRQVQQNLSIDKDVAKAFWVNMFDVFFNENQGSQGAAARSKILETQGVGAYASTTGLGQILSGNFKNPYEAATASTQSYTQRMIPLQAQSNSKAFTDTASATTQLLDTKVKGGADINELVSKDSAEWKIHREAIARSNAATEAEILTIENMIGITDADKAARKENVIQAYAEAEVRKKVATTQNAMAQKELENVSNTFGRSFTRMFSNMEQAINKASFSLGQMTSDLDLLSSALGGQAQTGKPQIATSNILQNQRAYSTTEVETAKGNASSLFGADAKAMKGLLGVGETIESTVMSTLNKNLKDRPGINNEVLASKVDSEVQTALEGLSLPSDLSSQLSKEVSKALEQLRTDGDKSIDFADLNNKLGSLSKVVDTAKQAQEIAVKALENYQNALNAYSDNINKITDLQVSRNAKLLKANDIQVSSTLNLNKALKQNINISVAKNTRDAKVASLTRGPTNVAGISANIQGLNTNRESLEEASNAAGSRAATGVDDVIKFKTQIANTNTALRENVEALKMLADNTDVASEAMNKIEEAQQRQSGKVSFIEKLVTSTPEEFNALNGSLSRLENNMRGQANDIRQSQGAQKAYNEAIAQGASGFEAMKAAQTAFANERKDTLGALQDILPFLGDSQQGNNIKADVLQSMLQESGVGVSPMLQQVLNTLRNPQADPATQAAIQEYKQANNLQSEANVALARIDDVLSNQLANKSAKALTDALKGTILNFDSAQLKDINTQVTQINAKMPAGAAAVGKASGGVIYASAGMGIDFAPQGTDTVPAMLTPGEFVVNRSATQANLPLLNAINSKKYSTGGSVKYYATGGYVSNLTKDEFKDTEGLESTKEMFLDPKFVKSNLNDSLIKYIYKGPQTVIRSQAGAPGADFENASKRDIRVNSDSQIIAGSAPNIKQNSAGYEYDNSNPHFSVNEMSKLGSVLSTTEDKIFSRKSVSRKDFNQFYSQKLRQFDADYGLSGNLWDEAGSFEGKIPSTAGGDPFKPTIRTTEPVGLIMRTKDSFTPSAVSVNDENKDILKIYSKLNAVKTATLATLSALVGTVIGTATFGLGIPAALAAGAATGAVGAGVGNLGYRDNTLVGTNLSAQGKLVNSTGGDTFIPPEYYGSNASEWIQNNANSLKGKYSENKEIFEKSLDFAKDPTKATFEQGSGNLENAKTAEKLKNIYNDRSSMEIFGTSDASLDLNKLDAKEEINTLYLLKKQYNQEIIQKLNSIRDIDTFRNASQFKKLQIGFSGRAAQNPDWTNNSPIDIGILDPNNNLAQSKEFPWISDTDPSLFLTSIAAEIEKDREETLTGKKFGFIQESIGPKNLKYQIKLPNPIGDVDIPYEMNYLKYRGPKYRGSGKQDDLGFNIDRAGNREFLPDANQFVYLIQSKSTTSKNPFKHLDTNRHSYFKGNTELSETDIFNPLNLANDRNIQDLITSVNNPNVGLNQDDIISKIKKTNARIGLESYLKSDKSPEGVDSSINVFANSNALGDVNVPIGDFLSEIIPIVLANRKSKAQESTQTVVNAQTRATPLSDLVKNFPTIARGALSVFGKRQIPGFGSSWLSRRLKGVPGVFGRPLRDEIAVSESSRYISKVFNDAATDATRLFPMVKSPQQYQNLKESYILLSGAFSAFDGIANGNTRLIQSITKGGTDNFETLFRSMGSGMRFQEAASRPLSEDFKAKISQPLKGTKIASVGADGSIGYQDFKDQVPKDYNELVSLGLNPYNEFSNKNIRTTLINKLGDDISLGKDSLGMPFYDPRTLEFIISNLKALRSWYGGENKWPGQDSFFDQGLDENLRTTTLISSLATPEASAIRDKAVAANRDLGLSTAFGDIPDINYFNDKKIASAKLPTFKATGGLIYASEGEYINFQPRGTDTVPAMLTPGEFVVNRAATQANLPLLKAMNSGGSVKAGGYSRGGVAYLARGGLTVEQNFKPIEKNIFDSIDLDKNGILDDIEMPKGTILDYLDFRGNKDGKTSVVDWKDYNRAYFHHIKTYLSEDAKKYYNTINPQKQKIGSKEIDFLQTYEAANKVKYQDRKISRNTLEEKYYSGDPNYPFTQATIDREVLIQKQKLGLRPSDLTTFGYGLASKVIPGILSVAMGGLGFIGGTAASPVVGSAVGAIAGGIAGDQLGQYINKQIYELLPESMKSDIAAKIEKYPESYEIGQWTGFAAEIAGGAAADNVISKVVAAKATEKLSKQVIADAVKSGDSSLTKLMTVGSDVLPPENAAKNIADDLGDQAATNSQKVDKTKASPSRKERKAQQKADRAETKAAKAVAPGILEKLTEIQSKFNSNIGDAYNIAIKRKYDALAAGDVASSLQILGDVRSQAAKFHFDDLLKSSPDNIDPDLLTQLVDTSPLYVNAQARARDTFNRLGIDVTDDFSKLDTNKMFDDYFNKDYDILKATPSNPAAAAKRQQILDDIANQYGIKPDDLTQIRKQLDDVVVKPKRGRFASINGLTQTGIMVAAMLQGGKPKDIPPAKHMERPTSSPMEVPVRPTIQPGSGGGKEAASIKEQVPDIVNNATLEQAKVDYYDLLTYKEFVSRELSAGNPPPAPEKNKFTTAAIYSATKGNKNRFRTTAYDQRSSSMPTEVEVGPNAKSPLGGRNAESQIHTTTAAFTNTGAPAAAEGLTEDQRVQLQGQGAFVPTGNFGQQQDNKAGNIALTQSILRSSPLESAYGAEPMDGEDTVAAEARSNDTANRRVTGRSGTLSQYKSAYSFWRTKLGEYNYHQSTGRGERYAEGNKITSSVAKTLATGGPVYASNGQLINFQPRGTDVVPAMLTPGEFVVNRTAASQNLPLLRSINSGNYSTGGKVSYFSEGDSVAFGGLLAPSKREEERLKKIKERREAEQLRLKKLKEQRETIEKKYTTSMTERSTAYTDSQRKKREEYEAKRRGEGIGNPQPATATQAQQTVQVQQASQPQPTVIASSTNNQPNQAQVAPPQQGAPQQAQIAPQTIRAVNQASKEAFDPKNSGDANKQLVVFGTLLTGVNQVLVQIGTTLTQMQGGVNNNGGQGAPNNNNSVDALSQFTSKFETFIGQLQKLNIPPVINIQAQHTVLVEFGASAGAFKDIEERLQKFVVNQVGEKMAKINEITEGGIRV